MKELWKQIPQIKNISNALSVIIIALSLSSILLSSRLLIFDLFSHFQLQYLVAIIFFIILNLILKNLKIIIPLGVYGAALTTFFILPINLVPEGVPEPDIFYINSNYSNRSTTEIARYIEGLDPTTVAVTEINPSLLQDLTSRYGAPTIYHDEEALSCAIFTKRDLIESYVINDTAYPICVARFQDYTLYLIHPIPPLNKEQYDAQEVYFSEVTALLDKEEKRFVLLGDFNSTYYSGQFREYFSQYFKKNIYTWSTRSPFALPIDHALSNKSIRVTKSDRLSSDHNGLIVDF